MSLPFGLNNNMFNIGFNTNFGFGMTDIGFMPSITSTSLPNIGLLGFQTNPIDNFCMNIMSDYAKMEREFFQVLMAILTDPNINHVPTPDILNNIRPYDYNSYGKNGDKISKLTPEMQEKTMQLLDYAKSQGMTVTINSGYRTQEEQRELQRTRGKYAAKNSLHCQGKAIDISIAGGKDSDYKKLGDYAKSIGMRWGGDFSTVKERWHFDLGWS